MARRATAADRIVEDDTLYAEPVSGDDTDPDTDGDTGGGSATTDSGDAATGDRGFGFFPDGRPRKRKPRSTAGKTPQRDTSSVHTRAQVRGLSKSIALSSQAAFDAIAGIRTMTLGFVPDLVSPTGYLMKPDGTPMGAGEVWKLDAKDAQELGAAWAEVIALYVPPELVERGAVLSTALVTLGMVVGTRMFADIQMQAAIKQLTMIRQEGIPHTPSNMAPNGVAPFPQATEPFVQERAE